MITVEIKQELDSVISGVYMISFSNGYFYIGSSRNMRPRILSHKAYIESGFLGTPSAKSLQPMAGFDGHVIISLVESIAAPMKMRYGPYKPIVDREMEIIRAYDNNQFILNDMRSCGIKRKTVLATVKPALYDKILALSIKNKKAITAIVEDLLAKALEE